MTIQYERHLPLVHGNKIYSPSTCIFVPQRINTLFVKKDMNRGDLPIGVHWDKSRNKYNFVGMFLGF